jgi:hypothetical protein
LAVKAVLSGFGETREGRAEDRLRYESGDLLGSMEYLPRMVMAMCCLFLGKTAITFLFWETHQNRTFSSWKLGKVK